MSTTYVPPHKRESDVSAAPEASRKGKGRGQGTFVGGKGIKGKGRGGYKGVIENPDLADVRQTSGSWDSVGDFQVAHRSFIKEPLMSTREDTVLRMVDSAAQYLLKQQQGGKIYLTHTRVKLVLGEVAFKRQYAKNNPTREDIVKQFHQSDRKHTEFRSTLASSNVPGVVEYFENMGFIKQPPSTEVEKQRRWQIYFRKKKRRSHIAYISHDGQNLKIRKLLEATDNNRGRNGYLKIDVLDNCGPPVQDWRLRLERHPLSNCDSDEAIRKWILQEVVVNGAGNLCPPVKVSEVAFECIRRKYKSPDKAVPKTHCTGIWKRGKLKLQIQYVEQTVSEWYRGDTNPGYELHISHEGLTEELQHTRWIEKISRSLNIHKLSSLLAELLLPVFDPDNNLVECDLSEKIINSFQDSLIPYECSLLGIIYYEEVSRSDIISNEKPFFDLLLKDLSVAKEADQKQFLHSRPCHAKWDCHQLVNKNGSLFSCPGSITGRAKCSILYKYPRERSLYFECKINHLRNDGIAKVGWLSPGDQKSYLYSELLSGDTIGTELNFLTGHITFWKNGDQLPQTPDFDFSDDLEYYKSRKYQPIVELQKSSFELINETEPIQEGFSREPTPLIFPDGCDSSIPNIESFDNPYDDDTNGYSSDTGGYPYVPASKDMTLETEEQQLPPENHISFDNLSKPWVKIGQGGFGAVYKCRHREYSDDVAIKELKTGGTVQSRRKFQKEIIDLMKVSKYGKILLCTGWSESDTGTLYMITEYCTEGSLTSKLKTMEDHCDIKDRVEIALEVGVSIAQALTHLHSSILNFVHLDVAARNVLIQRGSAYKLGDMGLLAAVGSPCPIICIPWSPPEMVLLSADKRRATQPHDCWSFGCLLYEIITGKEPYWHIRGIYGGETSYPVKTYMEDGKKIPLRPEEVPPVLASLWNYLERSLWNLDPSMRPKMHEVVVKLQSLRDDMRANFDLFTDTSHNSSMNSSDFNQAHTADTPAPPVVVANPSNFMSVSASPSKPKPKAKTFRKNRGKN